MHGVEFQARLLFITDFDNSEALTNEPAPNGINVVEACDLAVERLFGHVGLEAYHSSGGLNNRSPGEIVEQLAPGLDSQTHLEKTNDFVEEKLKHLLDQVGQRLSDGAFWPRISPYFLPLWERISDSPTLSNGVITSGHRVFVERFHEIHGLSAPEFMLTDDEMRPMSLSLTLEQCVKPSSFLLKIIHEQWKAKYGNPEISLETSKPQIVYAGDDITKDAKMAENYGVKFRLIDNARSPMHSWHLVADALDLLKGQSLAS